MTIVGTGITSPIQEHLEALHARFAGLNDGALPTYIPELTASNPDWFGICIATSDGQVYEAGDTRQPFTIQSIAKPLVYGIALEDRGRDGVLEMIGLEPTGDAFNAISLDPSGRPFNPMINAGAITTTSLVTETPDNRRILDVLSRYAGRPLDVDERVYRSEKETGHRNRAIGHMLRNFGILTADPEPVLDRYFRQSAILVTCRDLSLMAVTLSNGGVNPVTGERAVAAEYVEDILNVMTTCGMYDYAGEWVYRVGMPAKSGVGGGILAVLPGQLGIATFSPLLDARGNSARGVKTCEVLSQDHYLHFMNPPRSSSAVVRARYGLEVVRSRRRRTLEENRLLDSVGDRVRVYELQGDLRFSTAEVIVREITTTIERFDFVVIDLKHVTHVDPAGSRVLVELMRACVRHGRNVVLSGVQRHPSVEALLDTVPSGTDAGLTRFPDVDLAIDWCETQLLERHQPEGPSIRTLTLSDHQLCEGLSGHELDLLEGIVQSETFEPGETIFMSGQPSDKVYLLNSGEVSVVISLEGGRTKRLATFLPGMAFGETALFDGGNRTADVLADTHVECVSLSRRTFDELDGAGTNIKLTLVRNLLRSLTDRVNRLNRHVLALED